MIKAILLVFLLLNPVAHATDVCLINKMDGLAYNKGESIPFTGKYVETFSNGNKIFEINYKDGKKHGKETQWYYSQEKEKESFYVNGEIQGLDNHWYENGQEKQILTEQGVAIDWYENGVVNSIRFDDRNDSNGAYYFGWDEDGEPSYIEYMVGYYREGVQTYWGEDGKMYQSIYKDNEYQRSIN